MYKWVAQCFAFARNAFSVTLGDPFALLMNLSFLGFTLLLVATPVFAFGQQVEFVRDQALALALVGGCLAATLAAARIVTDDIRDGMVPTIMSRPVSASAFLFGKWLGMAAALGVLMTSAATACLWATRIASAEHFLETLGMVVYIATIVLAMATLALKNYLFKGHFVRDANLWLSAVFLTAFLLLNLWGYDGQPSNGYGSLVEWRCLAAFVYIAMALLVFAAMACACAVPFDQAALLSFGAFMFFFGLFLPYLCGFIPSVWARGAVEALLPNWQTYWIADQFSSPDFAFSYRHLASCLFHSLGQGALYVMFGAWLFKRREIAGSN